MIYKFNLKTLPPQPLPHKSVIYHVTVRSLINQFVFQQFLQCCTHAACCPKSVGADKVPGQNLLDAALLGDSFQQAHLTGSVCFQQVGVYVAVLGQYLL